MSDTKVRVWKATRALRDDHKKAKKLLSAYDKLDESDNAEKVTISEDIRRELTVHAQIEEELFYPAVAGASDAEGAMLVREAKEEHRIMKTLLSDLSSLLPTEEPFETKMGELRERLRRHIEEEESRIFPIFETLPKEEQERISEQLEARRRELSQEG